MEEGVIHHMELLRNKRYKIAWKAVEQGDSALFARLLKQQGYYTAPVEDYVKLINYHFNKFMKLNTFEQALAAVKRELTPPDRPANIIAFDTKEDVFEKEEETTTGNNILSIFLNKWKNG